MQHHVVGINQLTLPCINANVALVDIVRTYTRHQTSSAMDLSLSGLYKLGSSLKYDGRRGRPALIVAESCSPVASTRPSAGRLLPGFAMSLRNKGN